MGLDIRIPEKWVLERNCCSFLRADTYKERMNSLNTPDHSGLNTIQRLHDEHSTKTGITK